MPTSVRQYGIFGNIFNRFNKKESDENFIVGEDQFGNTYYEKQPSPEAPRQVPRRWIKYNDNVEMDIEKDLEEHDKRISFLNAEIPVEWKAWLQMKRKSPPTLEELLRNEALRLRTIQRAKELEERENEVKRAQKSSGMVTDSDTSKQSAFPTYPEYDSKIGEYRSDFLKSDINPDTDEIKNKKN